MKLLKPSIKPRATDPFTKGGQIFGHIWRMRWQNFKLVCCLSLCGFVVGFWICALFLGLTFQEFLNFYLLDYWGGHLKVIFWPSLKSFLFLADSWLKALMPGSRGIPEALYSVSQLTTTFVWSGASYSMPTIIFLSHPFVLAKGAQFHFCGWVGLGGFCCANLICYWVFRRKSQHIESEKILSGQKLISGKDLQKILTSSKQASDLYLTPDLSFVKEQRSNIFSCVEPHEPVKQVHF